MESREQVRSCSGSRSVPGAEAGCWWTCPSGSASCRFVAEPLPPVPLPQADAAASAWGRGKTDLGISGSAGAPRRASGARDTHRERPLPRAGTPCPLGGGERGGGNTWQQWLPGCESEQLRRCSDSRSAHGAEELEAVGLALPQVPRPAAQARAYHLWRNPRLDEPAKPAGGAPAGCGLHHASRWGCIPAHYPLRKPARRTLT